MQLSPFLHSRTTIHRRKNYGGGSGGLAPWILKFDIFLWNVLQYRFFFQFREGKWNFITFDPPGKSHYCPPWKKSFRRPCQHSHQQLGAPPRFWNLAFSYEILAEVFFLVSRGKNEILPLLAPQEKSIIDPHNPSDAYASIRSSSSVHRVLQAWK